MGCFRTDHVLEDFREPGRIRIGRCFAPAVDGSVDLIEAVIGSERAGIGIRGARCCNKRGEEDLFHAIHRLEYCRVPLRPDVAAYCLRVNRRARVQPRYLTGAKPSSTVGSSSLTVGWMRTWRWNSVYGIREYIASSSEWTDSSAPVPRSAAPRMR